MAAGHVPPPGHEDFTRAVLLSFDPTTEASLRRQANTSLEQLRQAEDGWLFCLQAFHALEDEQVRFFCLQMIVDMVSKQHRYASLPEEQRQTLRSSLVAWLQSKGRAETDVPVSIKNKFSQLVVAVLRFDYPQSWPGFFAQLLAQLGNGPVSIDLFLRVLNALNEDIVVHEEANGYDSEVANRVKDGMRDTCLAQIVDAWLSILQLHDTAPELCAACLHTVHLYVPWIPITLVATPRWLGVLQPFLRVASLHDGACLVLSEIVEKRMDAVSKMDHLAQLRIVPMLAEMTPQLQISPRFGALVSALALELLDSWDKLAGANPPTAQSSILAGQAVEQLHHVMPLLLACLAESEMETSQTTLSFLHSYVGRLRKLLPSPKELATQEPHLQNLLLVMARKSLYPDGFDFDDPDEPEEAFLAYRRELATLFKGVARVHAGLAQEMGARPAAAPARRAAAAPPPPACPRPRPTPRRAR
jgi:exportin-T